MFGVGILWTAVREHLDLVELMDTDDAAGVLAIAAGLAAEARGPTGVALRAFVQLEDLARMVAAMGTSEVPTRYRSSSCKW
ncbi:hypothetical protein GCM10020255_042370 [Rhodococcus baikonurensis]